MLQDALVTLVHLVGEKHLTVTGRRPPALIQRQVGRGGLDEEEDLLSLQTGADAQHHGSDCMRKGEMIAAEADFWCVIDLQDVVPHRGPATFNVEVSVAVFYTDQTIFSDFWLSKQGIIRPVVFYPGQLPYNLWTLHYSAHPGEHKEKKNASSFPEKSLLSNLTVRC